MLPLEGEMDSSGKKEFEKLGFAKGQESFPSRTTEFQEQRSSKK